MIKYPARIAVCLAAYNGLRWLPEQIESILAQADVDITLFISVDLSTDGTERYAESLAATNSKIVLLPYGERFGGAAPNFFRLLSEVDVSSYDFVALADQDDIWLSDKLSRAVTALGQRESSGYSSNVTAFWEGGQRRLIEKSQPQRQWDFLFEAAGPGCTYVIESCLAVRLKRCLLENSESLKDVGLHDWFIYAFARANGYKWIIDPSPSMLYRQHATNQVGANRGVRAFIYRVQQVLNGWALNQARLIARISGLEDDPFVEHWKRMRMADLLWLATQAPKCRRRPRDQVLFFLSCVGLALRNPWK